MLGKDNRITCREAAVQAANKIRELAGLPADATIPLAIIWGTGWGDSLSVDKAERISLRMLPGFQFLPELSGHARELILGEIGGKQVLIVNGRIHLYESSLPEDEIALMLRLLIETLIELGVKTMIATAAVGDLMPGKVRENGRVVAVDGFCTLYAGRLPLFGGEFAVADTVLDPELRRLTFQTLLPSSVEYIEGGHVMIRGPHFSSVKYDYPRLRETGVRVVGMSLLPEASVIAARNLPTAVNGPANVRMLALAMITDTPDDHLSDELVKERAKALSPKLGQLQLSIIRELKL